MAVDSVFIPRPARQWRGLDLRLPDLLRDPDASTTARNVAHRRTGSLTVPTGFKGVVETAGGSGLFRHVRTANDATRARTVELLVAGEKLYRQIEGTFVITYSGTDYDSLSASVLVAEDLRWHFYLLGDDTEVLDYDLGVGLDELTPVDLGDLESAIEAIADFSVTNTGITTLPAAFLPSLFVEPFSSGSLTITYEYMEQVYQPSGSVDPFAAHYAQRNNTQYELLDDVNTNNVLYLSSYWCPLTKYDGQKVYRAGVPTPSTPSVAVHGAGSGLTGTNIRFKIAFVQVDSQGNRIEGIISDQSGQVSPTDDSIDVTYARIDPNLGFNTDCATVDGVQSGVSTITVDTGHTIKVGDTIYFYNTAVSDFVERTVTGTTATSISFSASEGVVSVADYDAATGAGVISANLRVALYGQQTATSEFYFLTEFPHNSTVSSPVFRFSGASYGALYVDPIPGTERGLPPFGGYIEMYKGLLFIANGNTCVYSDSSSPEGFPPGANTFTINTAQQASFTGLHATQEFLALTKENSSHILTGDFDDNTIFRFKVDDLTLTAGASGHMGLTQILDGSLIMVNSKGVFAITNGQPPVEISEPIFPAFQRATSESESLVFRKAVVLYDRQSEYLLVYIPAETENSGSRYPNENSKLFAFNTYWKTWSIWEGYNPAAGAVFLEEDELYFVERRFSSVSSSVVYTMYKGLRSGTVYDYVQHNQPIVFEEAGGWIDLQSPGVFKKPIRIKLYSQDIDVSREFSIQASLEVDFKDAEIQNSITFDFGGGSGGGWSTDPWGVAPWGSPQEPELEARLRPVKCKSFRLRFKSEEIYKAPILTGVEYVVAGSFRGLQKE